ncbi:ORF1 [Dactylorhiza cryptic virus 1]|nr:ORF1 [Dactylorhiza cryptic virus 1]
MTIGENATLPASHAEDLTPQHLPVAMTQARQPAGLTRIADSLEDEYDIGFHRDKARKHRRYATLRSDQIFERLVTLYYRQFLAHWQIFRRLVESFALPANVENHATHAAIVYISAWFWDLYVSNRKCVEKISSTAFTQHYSVPQTYTDERYDPFLQHLNSVIRPTHIQNATEDAIYIPLLATAVNFEDEENPFRINRFLMNDELKAGLISIMELKNNPWVLYPLTGDTLGRPMWLFDWRLNRAYAWFPSEGNFSREDLVAAHILGIPCTPRLGPRDVDDWQFFPGNVRPLQLNPADYQRIQPRRFYGSAEYDTIAVDSITVPEATAPPPPRNNPRQKRKTAADTQTSKAPATTGVEPSDADSSESHQVVEATRRIHRFQLTTWCYHARVVLDQKKQMINSAFRNFLFNV